MSSLFRTYSTLLIKYPYTTQAIQTGTLMATGDLIAQTVIDKTPLNQINRRRTTEFFCIGTIMVGPILTTWYRFIARRIGVEGDKWVTMKKLAVDQLLFAPICSGTILTTIKLLENKNLRQTEKEVKEIYWDVLITGYKIWPLVQVVNFYMVPLQYQVALVQTVAVFWNTFISWKSHYHPEVESTKCDT